MNDDKIKAKHYRLDYNELGLSTLCVEKDKEIERLNKDLKDACAVIERLKEDKKETREFIERYLRLNLKAFSTKDLLEKILEILDKE